MSANAFTDYVDGYRKATLKNICGFGKLLPVFLGVFLLLLPGLLQAAPKIVAPKQMRPYSGSGVLMLSAGSNAEGEDAEPLYLYEEPAIDRLEELHVSKIPPQVWIFGANKDTIPLIVSARKGNWLRVAYDDAGREGWLNYERKGTFQRWDSFLKGKPGHLLPGLRKKYYQLFQQPDKGPQTTLQPKQAFKVLRLERDWAMVMLNEKTVGWLLWQDEDGRLLIGLNN